MPDASLDFFLLQMQAYLKGESARGLSDAELVQRFVGRNNELAFALLLERHGQLVLGVCRRLLGRSPDAQRFPVKIVYRLK